MELKSAATCGVSLLARLPCPTPSYTTSSAASPSCSFRRHGCSFSIKPSLGKQRVLALTTETRSFNCLHLSPLFSARNVVLFSTQAENAFVDVQVEEESHTSWPETSKADDDFGEVELILASRVEDSKTEYLISWKDNHPDSWEPSENIARDVVSEYEKPWWQAARKADADKLKELLDSEDVQRDVNAIDENERTALLFAAGLGSERCVRLLVEYGANVHWQDKDGFTALHIAAGYVHVTTVKALVELGADPDLEDAKGRSALSLAQELQEKTPKNNPLQFARRIALDQVVKALDEVMYETVEVEQILNKRLGEGGVTEYLVKWTDDSEDGWVSARDVGEDLVKDYEEGLEYGVVERIFDRREADGKVEYLVRWTDGAETWEVEKNVGPEVIADFNSSQATC